MAATSVLGSEQTSFPINSGVFLRFCEVAQSVAQTTSRLEKSRLLGEYFSGLVDEDLNRAALYLGGYVFPLPEGRARMEESD